MEQTSSLTEDSDTSPGSRVTASLVSPIWSRKEMPWNEPREFVGLGADWLPLESRLQMVAGGLGEGDGVGGAGWWGRAWNDLGEAGRGGGLLSVDIVCYLWRGGGRTTSKVNIQNWKKRKEITVSRASCVQSFVPIFQHWSPSNKASSHCRASLRPTRRKIDWSKSLSSRVDRL